MIWGIDLGLDEEAGKKEYKEKKQNYAKKIRL